jgi:hypothetical protein
MYYEILGCYDFNLQNRLTSQRFKDNVINFIFKKLNLTLLSIEINCKICYNLQFNLGEMYHVNK